MATPTFNLPTSGSDPRRATKEGLEDNINSIIQYLDDARIVGDDRGTEGFYNAGPWDASTGVFPIARKLGGSVQNGDTFFVQDGGAGVVDGQPQFEVGQRIIALVDNPSSTTYAGNWERANTIAILEPLTARVDSMSVPFDTIESLLSDTSIDYTNTEVGTIFFAKLEQKFFQVMPLAYSGIVTDNDGALLLKPIGDEITTDQFRCDRTGGSNTTSHLESFYNFCIEQQVNGRILSGTYLIDLGQIVLDNGQTDKTLPMFFTDGHFSTTYKAAANIDAPFIKISNGTAASGVGRFWQGGGHGGVSFKPAAGSVTGLPNMSGLSLAGIVSAQFGFMKADGIGGDTITIPENLFGGNNPDPYNVSACRFMGAEANRSLGRAFGNYNWVGMAGCYIDYIRAIETGLGAFHGQGAANEIRVLSAGSTSGWFIGDPNVVTGGASTRFKVGYFEADDVEFGINSNIASQCDYGTGRFVHRYQFGPNNSGTGLYWPRKCVDVGGTGRANIDLHYRIIHRIEAGGTKADLGEFVDFNSAGANIVNCNIQSELLDNATFGFDLSDMYANLSGGEAVDYRQKGKPVVAQARSRGAYLRARMNSGAVVKTGGFTGAAANLEYGTLLDGPPEDFDAATATWTSPGEVTARVYARFVLNVPDGVTVRIALMINGAPYTGVAVPSTGVNRTYILDETYSFSDGDTVTINASTNAASDTAVGFVLNANDNMLTIREV